MRYRQLGVVILALGALPPTTFANVAACADGLAGMRIEWTAGPAADSSRYWVQGTEISVLGEGNDFAIFQAHAGRVFGALAAAPGCIAYSFAQVPGTTTFRTVSLWTDRASLEAFVQGKRHRGADTATRGKQTAPARFGAWETTTRPVFWEEVAATLVALPPRPPTE